MFENRNLYPDKKKKIIVSKKIKYVEKDNYILGETIYKSTFTKIKIGIHKITNEKVAIKIITKQNNPYLSKIKNNLEIIRHLHHKNILQLFEIIEENNKLYIVMEYCEKGTILNYINDNNNITENEICRLFQQIINCAEYLKLCNISFNNIKPENIFLDNDKRIKISLFGLFDSNNFNIENNEIYNLGIILYKMLIRKKIFVEEKNKLNLSYPKNISKDSIDLINNMIRRNSKEKFEYKNIELHHWFNLIKPKMRPGIVYNVHKIPIDDNILTKVENLGYNRIACKKSILKEKYDSLMAIYLLILRQSIKEGNESIADLFSDKYLEYINDYKNWINKSKINSPLYKEKYNVINMDMYSNCDKIINSNENNINQQDNLYNTDMPNEGDNMNFDDINKKGGERNSDLMNDSFNLKDFSSKESFPVNNDFSEISRNHNKDNFNESNSSSKNIEQESENTSNVKYNLFLTYDDSNLSLNKINSNKIKKIKNKKDIITKRNKKQENLKQLNIKEIINKRILKIKQTDKENKKNIENTKSKRVKFDISNKNNQSNNNLNDQDNESNNITNLLYFIKDSEDEIDLCQNKNLISNIKTSNYNHFTPKKNETSLKQIDNNKTKNKTEIKNYETFQINDTLLPFEPLEKNIKYNLKKKITENIINFEKDIKTLNQLHHLNMNDNEEGGLNIRIFAEKLINATIFKDCNKKDNDEIINKYNFFNKYEKSLKLIINNYKEKLSESENIEKMLEDEDDKVFSKRLLNNKYFSSFIRKLKTNNKKKINKRSRSKNFNKSFFLDDKNILNRTYFNFNINNNENNPKCELDNIIMNQTQSIFYGEKSNRIKNDNSIIKRQLLNKYKLLKSFSPNANDIQALYSNYHTGINNIDQNINNNSFNQNRTYFSKKKLNLSKINKSTILDNISISSIQTKNLDEEKNRSIINNNDIPSAKYLLNLKCNQILRTKHLNKKNRKFFI